MVRKRYSPIIENDTDRESLILVKDCGNIILVTASLPHIIVALCSLLSFALL